MLYNSLMSKKEESSFIIKLYIIAVLILACIGVLLYLIFSGATEKLQPHSSQESAVPCEPCIVPSPDAQPSEEPTAEPEPTPDETPETSPEPTPETSKEPEESEKPEPTYNPADDDIDSNDSVLKIVSPSRTISASYVPENLRKPDVPAIDDVNQNLLRDDAADALEEMFAAAKKDGHNLYLVSGYRSYEFQQRLWDYWVREKGKAYADELDSHPGGSEHQLGLACNLGTVEKECELRACFSDTAAYEWLLKNSWKYGYIERYPEGKQEITGITYSPWNFRFTGKDAADRIYHSGLTMEEYYGLSS